MQSESRRVWLAGKAARAKVLQVEAELERDLLAAVGAFDYQYALERLEVARRDTIRVEAHWMREDRRAWDK